MSKVDNWIMSKIVEPAACEIESWTGINHWQVTRFFVLSWTVSDGIWTIDKGEPIYYASFGLTLIGAAMWVAMTFLYQYTSDDTAGRHAHEPRHNRFWIFLRLFQLTVVGMSIGFCLLEGRLRLATLGSVSILGMYYFFACERLPPKERRLFSSDPISEPAR
jgi:hypothetical protein